MRVRATQQGYYGHKRIREGQVFNLVDRKYTGGPKKGEVMKAQQQFSEYWMEKVGKGAKSKPAFNPADGRIANREAEAQAEADLDQTDEVVDSNQDVI